MGSSSLTTALTGRISSVALIDTLDRVIEFRKKEPTYPADHVPALRVPEGGSSCASCRWLSDDHKHCCNRHFIRWHGSDRLPYPADEFCSDWWEHWEE
jgi:hypothetical protein